MSRRGPVLLALGLVGGVTLLAVGTDGATTREPLAPTRAAASAQVEGGRETGTAVSEPEALGAHGAEPRPEEPARNRPLLEQMGEAEGSHRVLPNGPPLAVVDGVEVVLGDLMPIAAGDTLERGMNERELAYRMDREVERLLIEAEVRRLGLTLDETAVADLTERRRVGRATANPRVEAAKLRGMDLAGLAEAELDFAERHRRAELWMERLVSREAPGAADPERQKAAARAILARLRVKASITYSQGGEADPANGNSF